MRTFFAAIAITATAATALPSAAATLKDEKSTIETLTSANVSALLNDLGAQDVQTTVVNGTNIVKFNNAGVTYNAAISCDKLGCTTLQLMVAVNTGSNRFSSDTVNTANKNSPFVQIYLYDANTLFFSRATFTDGGVPRRNLAVNIVTYLAEIKRLATYLDSQVIAGFQPDGSSPFQPVSAPNTRLQPRAMSPEEILTVIGKTTDRKQAGSIN